MRFFALISLVATVCPTVVRCDDPPYQPSIAPASDEAKKAIARFRLPPGLKADVFAAEPMLAHPVAIVSDNAGRWYVAETFRHQDGVTDTRGHMNWLVDDLASRSVDERVAMYKKYLSPEEFAQFGVHHERVRLLVDKDGDGHADADTVFADGFNTQATGLGAGVLPVGRDVFFACIPDLWRLRDADGDGRADERVALQSGYGVHVQFLGHDLHGLIVGPDGRLYFSVGDRGMNVTTVDGKKVLWPDSGAILRSEFDGSKLEIIHVGLRNPQELAFDDWGNLFTVDNNSDGGDKARLVWVTPGADSGWRVGFQYLDRPTTRGGWNSEKMWHPQTPEQPAFLLPPLANFSDGPGGLVYNPGTALRPEDRERFYLADFRGSPGDSGVRRFGLRSKGAAFELVDETQFVWGLEATDVAFGVDGALYISDWVEGWNKTGKGRIYRISEENVSDGAQKESTRELLAKGVGTSNVQELAGLLAHPDQRVRQMAQFELARRAIEKERALNGRAAGPNDLLELSTIAGIALSKTQPRAPTVARFHATCAWWQVERARGGKHSDLLMQLLSDDEPAIRLQAARALNDLIASDGPSTVFPSGLGDGLVKATSDSDKRVALYAAMALGGLAKAEFVEPLRLLLQKNDDADAYLRHAGVMGLSGIAASQPKLVWALADDSSSAVRMGVLLVMRKLRTAEVARFLNDPDPRVALEAARAIYDTAIDEALPALADRKIDRNTPTPLVRRVVAARFRRGSSEDAAALANLCAAPGFTSSLRIEFINTLADWASAPPLDRITGLYRPVAKHEAAEAAAALSQTAPALLRDESELVVQAAERAVAALKLTPLVPRLIELAKDGDRSSSTRVEALRALDALSAPGLPKVVREAIKDKNRSVRAEALAILARVDPSEALGVLKEVLNTGTVEEKQRGFATLATIDDPQVDPLLGTWLDRLLAGDVPPTVRLDLLEAAEQRKSAPIEEKLARYQASLPKDDPLAAYEATLEGGRAARGERIFREKAEVSCLRCHKIRGQGGEVGPELTGIGGKKDRRYLLQALVTPDAQIAEGFDTKVLALKDGRLVSGIVKRADEHELTLVNAEAHTLVVPRAQIEEETRGQSAMPQDVSQKLTRQELRDLIEYLSSLR